MWDWSTFKGSARFGVGGVKVTELPAAEVIEVVVPTSLMGLAGLTDASVGMSSKMLQTYISHLLRRDLYAPNRRWNIFVLFNFSIIWGGTINGSVNFLSNTKWWAEALKKYSTVLPERRKLVTSWPSLTMQLILNLKDMKKSFG